MSEELARWKAQAQAVTIVRDDWGIAHVRGGTDAEAIFGLMYAQAEDDFNRIETNYINALGRLAQAEGESAIYNDLRMRLFIDASDLEARYAASPPWLQALMDAWADGLNYYLAVHPNVTPRVIKHFEPWMALSFTEGSVGGDIERVSLEALEAFYGTRDTASAGEETPAAQTYFQDSSGSNGFAIAPCNTAGGRALLLINPHPDFFFRSEVQVESEQGLNVYGTVTWGQFFVYQGFNERAGWAHTTTGADVIDEYTETIVPRGGHLFYRHGDSERPVEVSTIVIPYRTAAGTLARRRFTVYRTHHGPIVRQADGQWIAVALMHRPVEALSQSFLRTKARDYLSFRRVAELKANSLANTIFADADGNIAYFHPQFIPRRDDRFDFTQPVDGADPATDWNGLHALEEAPHLLNPPNGWIANTNNWPYSAAGPFSPDAKDYPRYMDTAGENPRGINAARVLEDRKDFTLQSLIAAAYDSYLSGFARLIPALIAAYDQTPAAEVLKDKVTDQIALLRGWDCRCGVDSIPTSLAVFWGEQLLQEIGPAVRASGGSIASYYDFMLLGRYAINIRWSDVNSIYDYLIDRTSSTQKLQALASASDRLVRDFGCWRTPWGEINRFQRLSGDILPTFDDARPSTPVPTPSSLWGALASFKARRHQGTKRYYGTSGNSFVAVVEFGETVRALAVSAGGASGDPGSPHFNDQAARFATGDLREVYFYPRQLQGHIERTYHPGD